MTYQRKSELKTFIYLFFFFAYPLIDSMAILIVAIIFIIVIVWFVCIKRKYDKLSDPVLDGEIEYEKPALVSEMRESEQFADQTVSFDITGSFDNVWNWNRGVGSGDVPQLTEVAPESPEFKRQMKSLIDYMIKVGYDKKIVNYYVMHIKDHHLNPSLILMKMKNDPNAPPPNISEDPMTS